MIPSAASEGARTSGTAGVAEMACNMLTAVSNPIMPCCKSTVTASKP